VIFFQASHSFIDFPLHVSNCLLYFIYLFICILLEFISLFVLSVFILIFFDFVGVYTRLLLCN
jgi:hypothetical protein